MVHQLDNSLILKRVHELHKALWEERFSLLGRDAVSPTELLDPRLACALLGITFEEYPEIPNRFGGRNGHKIAGLLDRQARKVAVSTDFSEEVVRFTGAHEVGHWLMHPDTVMHRDLPIGDAVIGSNRRDRLEREADYFAAHFLMPERLVKSIFREKFRVDLPMHFSEGLAFALSPSDPDVLMGTSRDSLDRELAMAGCRSLGTTHFRSMAEEFRVSTKAMAIQLKEFRLIDWP